MPVKRKRRTAYTAATRALKCEERKQCIIIYAAAALSFQQKWRMEKIYLCWYSFLYYVAIG